MEFYFSEFSVLKDCRFRDFRVGVWRRVDEEWVESGGRVEGKWRESGGRGVLPYFANFGGCHANFRCCWPPLFWADFQWASSPRHSRTQFFSSSFGFDLKFSQLESSNDIWVRFHFRRIETVTIDFWISKKDRKIEQRQNSRPFSTYCKREPGDQKPRTRRRKASTVCSGTGLPTFFENLGCSQI